MTFRTDAAYRESDRGTQRERLVLMKQKEGGHLGVIDQNVDPMAEHKEKVKADADEAKEKSEKEHRRSLELRASFYEKLSTLDAGSIAVAVSVGIALLGKSESRIGSIHSNLSWLAVIAVLLWMSLICAIGHNSIFVKIARLEAEHAKAWSNYLALISAHASASTEVAEVVCKHIADSLKGRIDAAAMNTHRTDLSVNRVMVLGYVAVASFLLAYTLVLVCVLRLWWLTR
jgi:hypothetical protein